MIKQFFNRLFRRVPVRQFTDAERVAIFADRMDRFYDMMAKEDRLYSCEHDGSPLHPSIFFERCNRTDPHVHPHPPVL